MRKISKIYIHHSALPENEGVHKIRKLHIAQGYNDIGYHFVIDKKGKVWKGRDLEKEGAHVKSDNANSIGICVCGNFEIQKPLNCQLKTLEKLIGKLFNKFGNLILLGHKDYNPDTLCPGTYLYSKIPNLRREK